ncbi:MAG: Eco57I restriction-modification methylase domain-containing protein, partial [Candidatus Micrarchaeaceae archaeon]
AKAGIQAPAKTDLFAFFIYHSLRFMKEGSRLGFVTPASWLTADYALSLQQVLVNEIRLTAVIASNAESFFPQVDVNTVLLVAEKVADGEEDQPIRFVTLKQPIIKLTQSKGNYWTRIVDLATEIESGTESTEDDRYRLKLVNPAVEREGLTSDRSTPRNWSKFIRAPLSYYEIFEGGA